jgi:MoaA/NifB/PqqE/SkfB family radical SAM enzyme
MFNFSKKKIEKSLVFAGILNGRRAYVGPEVLHIDLTNECNNDCIGCWCRSPLLKDKEMPEWEKRQTIPFKLIKQVLDDIYKLRNLKQVKLVGGGEPFMHLNILDTVAYIKNQDRNIEIDINTNFTLVNEKVVKDLIGLGVDSMTVSLWAGEPLTYVKTHPNKTEDTFYKIEEMLKLIASLKNGRPWIKIYNVISKVNYDRLQEMLDFALRVKAEAIQFVLLDPIPQRTDCLLLNEEEKKVLLETLYRFKQNYNSLNSGFTDPKTGLGITITELDELIRRLNNQASLIGIYDENVVDTVPCYVGWLFARITAVGNVVPCCKGHRMVMGNIYQDSFRKIWHSRKYREFRFNAKHKDKIHPYFSKMGNDATKKSGCYNCDNLWQNEPMHRLISSLPAKTKRPWKLFLS